MAGEAGNGSELGLKYCAAEYSLHQIKFEVSNVAAVDLELMLTSNIQSSLIFELHHLLLVDTRAPHATYYVGGKATVRMWSMWA